MSKEKNLTPWVSFPGKYVKNSRIFDDSDEGFEKEPDIDEDALEHYETIEQFENRVEEQSLGPNRKVDQKPSINQLKESRSAPPINIREILERIVFNEQELSVLKSTINNFIQGKITPKVLKTKMLNSYIRIFHDIEKFLSFYLAQETKNLAEHPQVNQKEYEEKDMLLDQMALHLDKIYRQLRVNVSSPLDIDDYKTDSCIQTNSSISEYEHTNDQLIYIHNELYKAEECNFVVDGANIALEVKNHKNQAMISNLYQLVEKLNNLGITRYKVLSDAKLHHIIDDKEAYIALKERAEFDEMPAGTEADFFILQYAKQKDAFIITNDLFRQHYSRFGKEWINKKRITFKFIDRTLIFDRMYPISQKEL